MKKTESRSTRAQLQVHLQRRFRRPRWQTTRGAAHRSLLIPHPTRPGIHQPRQPRRHLAQHELALPAQPHEHIRVQVRQIQRLSLLLQCRHVRVHAAGDDIAQYGQRHGLLCRARRHQRRSRLGIRTERGRARQHQEDLRSRGRQEPRGQNGRRHAMVRPHHRHSNAQV